MKCLFVLCCVLAAVVSEYTNKYDNIDIDEILTNDRLLKKYGDCLLERGKCTAEGNELKGTMGHAMKTRCEECTEAQKKGAAKVIGFLIKNKPEIWNELAEKYDPDHKYRTMYEEEARANGIVIP